MRIKFLWLFAVFAAGMDAQSILDAGPADPATFNIRQYGAVGDGRTLDSSAINKAIAACSETGGGQVLFPPGRYLSGTLELRSRVTLFFEAGAILVGTTNLDAYRHFTPPAGTHEAKFKPQWHRALLLGDGLEDVSILGHGVIDGNKVFDPRGEERMRGPHTILIGNSRRIQIEGLSIRDSANYAIMLEDCDEVAISKVRITGGWDGVHFRGFPGRSCRDVRIIGCEFYTGDDAIAGRYWENVLISGCVINSSCNGIRLIGPATGLIVHDCLFYGPGLHPHRTSNRYNMLAAVCLQPGAWDSTEGHLDQVALSDLTMRDVTTPFMFTLKPGNTAGSILVERVSASGVYHAAASVESWAPTPFTNVVFRDISIEFAGGGKLAPDRSKIRSPGVDARGLPVWGFYARNVEQVKFENVRLTLARPDQRPVLGLEQVGRFEYADFKLPNLDRVEEAMVFNSVGEIHPGPDEQPPRVECLKLDARSLDNTSSDLVTGKPYAITALVTNTGGRGAACITATVNGTPLKQWIWAAPGQNATATFHPRASAATGKIEAACGTVTRSFDVR